MGRKKKSSKCGVPKDGTFIFIKLDGGIWWPGFVEEQQGTFFDEEDVMITLNKSNWKEMEDVDEQKIVKSMGKLKGKNKEKFARDLDRVREKHKVKPVSPSTDTIMRSPICISKKESSNPEEESPTKQSRSDEDSQVKPVSPSIDTIMQSPICISKKESSNPEEESPTKRSRSDEDSQDNWSSIGSIDKPSDQSPDLTHSKSDTELLRSVTVDIHDDSSRDSRSGTPTQDSPSKDITPTNGKVKPVSPSINTIMQSPICISKKESSNPEEESPTKWSRSDEDSQDNWSSIGSIEKPSDQSPDLTHSKFDTELLRSVTVDIHDDSSRDSGSSTPTQDNWSSIGSIDKPSDQSPGLTHSKSHTELRDLRSVTVDIQDDSSRDSGSSAPTQDNRSSIGSIDKPSDQSLDLTHSKSDTELLRSVIVDIQDDSSRDSGSSAPTQDNRSSIGSIDKPSDQSLGLTHSKSNTELLRSVTVDIQDDSSRDSWCSTPTQDNWSSIGSIDKPSDQSPGLTHSKSDTELLRSVTVDIQDDSSQDSGSSAPTQDNWSSIGSIDKPSDQSPGLTHSKSNTELLRSVTVDIQDDSSRDSRSGTPIQDSPSKDITPTNGKVKPVPPSTDTIMQSPICISKKESSNPEEENPTKQSRSDEDSQECIEDSHDSGSESDSSAIWPFLTNPGPTTCWMEWAKDSKKQHRPLPGDSDDDFDDSDNDPSYIPADEERESEADVSDEENNLVQKRNADHDSSELTVTKKRKVSADLEESDHEIDPTCSKTDLVAAVLNKADGRRKYDKRQACFYCGGLFAKISSHLQNIHDDEATVCEILSKPKKGVQRKHGWQKLRNKGNFQHNIKILTGSKAGSIIVDRRPAKDKGNDCFLPCPSCLAFIIKDDLWRHSKTCPFVDVEKDEKSIKKQATLLLHGSTSSSEDKEGNKFRQEVLEGMKQDKVFDTITKDKLLVLLGSTLLNKNGKERVSNVRQKIREMGRLLLVLTETRDDSSCTFNDFLTPGKFDVVVRGVKKLCTLEGETMRGCDKYERPALALKVGHTLKKLAQIKVGQALRNQDEKEKRDAQNYLTLHNDEWCDKISSHAISTLSERKFNNPDILPLTEDIVCLRKYLLKEMKEKQNDLNKQPDINTWRNLAQLTLCRICVFNRRRGGEVGEMLLTSYTTRNTDKGSKGITSSLEPIEQKLMERLQLVEILGKRRRKVPVILTADMIEAVDCMNKHRPGVGVPTINKYLFAAPTTSNGHLKGWDALHMVSEKAGLKQPHLMRTTNLRKYIATVSQIVDMGSNQELEWLANHMGHSLAVHREYYRLQEKTLELAKVSKLLMAVDKGLTHKYAGRRLDEITLDEIEDDPDEPNQHETESDGGEGDVNVAMETEPDKESDDGEGDITVAMETEPDKAVEQRPVGCKKKKVQRKSWRKEDKLLLCSKFHSSFVNACPPSKSMILLKARTSPDIKHLLDERGWKSLKFYVWSLVQQHTKKKKELMKK